MTSDACIVGIGQCLGRGTIISIFLVLFVLPQILLVGGKLVDKTSFSMHHVVLHTNTASGRVRELLQLFNAVNQEGQTILMVTHSTKAASHAKRVLFIKDGEVFHQLYRGNMNNEELYAKISDTLTMLTTGGEQNE